MKIKLVILYIISILLISALCVHGATTDNSWKVFDDKEIGEVQIVIDPTYLEYILTRENQKSDSLFPATFIYKNAEIAGDTLKDIGFRIRGNTSRGANKKSFKIDINHFVPGRQFYGLEKLNINGEQNDPSIIRSKLCWDLFNVVDIPASRANHVRLFINGQYRGLYMNVEHIDDEFVQKRFGNQNGNLYKCLYPADLVYHGPDQEEYKRYFDDRQAYDLKTNKEIYDYSDLIHFIEVLNTTPQGKFKQEIEKVFNVENFLKWLALNVVIGSWDDYWRLKNNYYLYHNTATDKFEFIPYDYDNTYGIDWVGGDWGTRNVYNWGHPSEARPLVTRILSIPEYRNTYTQHLADYINNEFAFQNQEPKIDHFKEMITPAVENDTYTNFSIEDFHKSYIEPLPGTQHVHYGLKPYITTRISTARAQLNFVSIPPSISDIIHFPQWPVPNQPVTINARVEANEGSITSVRLFAKTPATSYTLLTMLDDGNHQDGAANDGVYGTNIIAQPEGTLIYYYIEATVDYSTTNCAPQSAPENAFYYLVQQSNAEDVLVALHVTKKLAPADVAVGLLGSFNNWNNIYPLVETENDFWQISFYLAPGSYIYKFVTYDHLAGQEGVNEWFADPEIAERDGAPYFNTVLQVTNPMIYYVKPFPGDTVHSFTPTISAEFACSRNTSINEQSILLKIDDQAVENAFNYYIPEQKKLMYKPRAALSRGEHVLFLAVQNSMYDLCEISSRFTILTPSLYVNEFMADNRSSISDENSEFDDWIELYNNSDQSIQLAGFYLTDDLSEPGKWPLPDTSIAAYGYLLIWADSDPKQGTLHASFKLSKDGEQIGLFKDFIPIDTLTFQSQKTDTTYGRYIDGANNWQYMPPTPGRSNVIFTGLKGLQSRVPEKFELFQNYPNPFNPVTNIKFALSQSEWATIKIYNISGQLIHTLVNRKLDQGFQVFQWRGIDDRGRKVTSGVYFYRLECGQYRAMKKMILLR